MKSGTQAVVQQHREFSERIKNVLIDRLELNLEPDEIAEDAPLFGMGLGLDSIDALVLIVGIEDEFNITVDTSSHNIYRSVNTLTEFLIANVDQKEATAQ